MTRRLTCRDIEAQIRSSMPEGFEGVHLNVRQLSKGLTVIVPLHRVNGVQIPKMTFQAVDSSQLVSKVTERLAQHVSQF